MIEPVGVFQENYHWYVYSYCVLRKDYRHFRLDRIQKISQLNTVFTEKHLPIETLQLKDKNASSTAIYISISVPRSKAHYLEWEQKFFGFDYDEVISETMLIKHFNCTVALDYFARWFMMFVDCAVINEPLVLKEKVSKILHNGVLQISK